MTSVPGYEVCRKGSTRVGLLTVTWYMHGINECDVHNFVDCDVHVGRGPKVQ